MAQGFKQQKSVMRRAMKANKGKTVRVSNVPTWKTSKRTGRYSKKTGRTTSVRFSKPSKRVTAQRAASGVGFVASGLAGLGAAGHALAGDNKSAAKYAGASVGLMYASHKTFTHAQSVHTRNMNRQPKVQMSYGQAQQRYGNHGTAELHAGHFHGSHTMLKRGFPGARISR